MTFQDLVDRKAELIGKYVESYESGLIYSSKVLDVVLNNKYFEVYCDDGKTLGAHIDYSSVKEYPNGDIGFTIPCIGHAKFCIND
jgi:hypothetical protein